MTHADADFKRLSKKQKDQLARQSLVKTYAKKAQNQRARVARKIKGEVRIERWVPRDQVEEVRQLLSLHADARKHGEVLWIRVAPAPDGQDSGLVIEGTGHVNRPHSMVPAGQGKDSGTHPAATTLRERFYIPSYKAELKHMIAGIVAAEGPLPLDVLELKVAKRHGFASSGTKIREWIRGCLDGVELHAEPQINNPARTFVWVRDTFGPRAPWRGRRDRDLADISRHEWADLLDRNGDELDGAEDPVRAAAALAGVKSLVEPTRRLLTAYREWWRANPSILDRQDQSQLAADGQDERVVLPEG